MPPLTQSAKLKIICGLKISKTSAFKERTFYRTLYILCVYIYIYIYIYGRVQAIPTYRVYRLYDYPLLTSDNSIDVKHDILLLGF